ncbi:hypothetical protein [Yoonia sp. 208BN28-4]|uniref:hypothetical protein n=1 Tax=Yoonia sp. 208BN28-4 TaxID=3126505 RepID=UPI0030998545
MEQIIAQLVAGAVGGNAAGAGLKNLSLGTMGNTITGLIGGLGGGQILGMLTGGAAAAGDAATGTDMSGLVAQLVGGGAGGAVLTAIIGFVKNKMAG